MISAERLLQENLPQLQGKPWLQRPATWLLRNLIHEREFTQFAAQYPHLHGIEFVEQVLDYFNFTYSVRDTELDNIPSHGRVVIIANHPIGSLDGLALLKMVSKVRPDVKVVANDLLAELPPLADLLLPVRVFGGTTQRGDLQRINQHLNDDAALIIFPSGEVSRLRPNGVRDTRWRAGFLRMAMTAQAPILPVFIDARNSAWFYGASMVYKPLATMLLVKEMFRQQANNINMRIGELVPFSAFAGNQIPLPAKVKLFKKHLYRIGHDKNGMFNTQSAIAWPEQRQALKAAVEQCECLGKTFDNKHIYLYQYQGSSPILREIGRLREVAFRAVGEGTLQRRDLDSYDTEYYHLLLWDADDLEIAGAYRLGDTAKINASKGRGHLYSDSLFDFDEAAMQPIFAHGLELGRSFVQPRYWGKRSLEYLWIGIGALLRKHPQYRYLFGSVSISSALPIQARELLVHFYRLYFPATQTAMARHHNPFVSQAAGSLNELFVGDDYKADFSTLKHQLAHMGVAIPTLYKQYSELCDGDGVQFLDFGVDPDFSDSIDGLVLVDIEQLKPKKYQRYIAARD
ncbi:GNAT family N-acyltransferase [Idiomarina xiamenensis]|uniref:L-ornithine N(alpha)-acyltransferase n=1 Tax=Idiomarina xiamenensis 10-D-4 TaxID=740709 RepID=K2K822_9GAMM|nr:GNAT family N-acyltransferase [Idiomarina xiamenensis]EKE83863.1 phosphate acyltransferase [Idiomarina xiamenensis 10-D-4]